MVVELQDLYDYLGIDYADDMVKRNATRAIKAADAFIKGGVAEDYPEDDPRAKELALALSGAFYDARGAMSDKALNNYRRMIDDIMLQLRCEARRANS